MAEHKRHARVAALADGREHGQLAEDRDAELRRGRAEARGAAEDVVRRAARRAGVERLVEHEAGDLRAVSTRGARGGSGRTGTETLRNMEMPLRTSESATSCGVLTMTAPARAVSWGRTRGRCTHRLRRRAGRA